MNLLAIDTATEQFSAALACGSDTWHFEANAGLRHSELVIGSIDMLLKTAAIRQEELSGIVCMGGPGSFTGLRIGFSTAKGLALSLGIPFAAIPTLDCMAWPFSSLPLTVAPVLDAKKQAFFCALYRDGKRLCPDMDAGPDEIARTIAEKKVPVTLFGPGAPLLYEKLSPLAADITLGKGLRWGNALALLEMAKETDVFANSGSNYFIGPEYIRKSDAELMGSTVTCS